MSTARRTAIAHAFGRAAPSYDAAADLQRRAAALLADHIAALALPAGPRVLEIGCGTGLLTGLLAGRLAPSWYLATDIAEPMLAACRVTHAGPALRFVLMDGEAPCLAGGQFDLVCASLAVQWFADPAASLARWHALLRPGGAVAFATLGPQTLAEWRAAHAAEGFAPPTAAFAAPSDLARAWRGASAFTTQTVAIRHGSGLAFLRGLRAIGAGVPRVGHRALPRADLRRVLTRFEAAGCLARYQLVIGLLSR